MIELHQFIADWDLPNLSPFCLKTETWLRMAGLEYVVKPWSPTGAPLGKAPFVVVDGQAIADSSVILRELTERFDVQLDVGMSPRDRATAILVQRTLEEHTYWAELFSRWVDPTGWAAYKPVLGSTLPVPALARGPMLAFIRRGPIKSGQAHGLHRHTPEEIYRRALEDVEAIAEYLGDGPYMLGEVPRSVDATVYGFLAQIAHPLWDGRPREFCRRDPRIAGYLERMRTSVWDNAVA